MKFCCAGLQNLVGCAGERGIAVVVWLDSRKEPRLLLQSRGISYEDSAKLCPVNIDVEINLSAEVGMRYCLACGTLLEDVVGQDLEFFRALAKEHEKLLPRTLR